MKKMIVVIFSILVLLAVMLLAGCTPDTKPEVIVITATPVSTVLPTEVVVLSPTVEPTAVPTVRPPTPTASIPTIDDFEIEIVVLEKQCFGSAGCIITWEPNLIYMRVRSIPNKTYTILYELHGSKDGIMMFNVEVTGTQFSLTQKIAQTAHADDELTAVITRILVR